MTTSEGSSNEPLEETAGAEEVPPAPAGPPSILGGRKPGKLRLLVRLAGFFTCLGIVAGGAFGGGMYAYYSRDLPPLTSVTDYRPKLATRVYSVDGRLIGEFGTERRIIVPYERIPKKLIQAFIAAEDKNFFEHGGVDFLGIVRAVVFKVAGVTDRIKGTSTLTQQLAKSLLVEHMGYEAATARSISRKAKEMILARRLEKTMNKEEIIWLYLNQVFLGHGAYGVQAASEHYFRKDVFELTLPEVALLAGLPQAPSRYSPLISPKAASQRVSTVLKRMRANGFITEGAMTEALAVDLVAMVKPRDDRFRDTAPYFTEHVRRYVYDTYGEKALYEGGLQVFTTLDLERQNHAEIALTNGVREVDKRQGWRGPVAHVKDGDIQRVADVVEKKQIKGAALDDGWPYMAVVTDVDGTNQYAKVLVGKTEGVVPLATAQWAREPNPNRRHTSSFIRDIRQALKKGDVVMVTPETEKTVLKMAFSVEGARSVKNAPAGSRFFALDQIPVVEGALIAMNQHTGYVESMIGGYSFEDSEFNRAFQACRQPGSSFKPVVYSAAIVREDLTPATMVLDTPITLRDADIGKSWKPQNFELEFKGEVTARNALMNSMNVPALHTMLKVGVPEVLAWAKKLGIRTTLKEELGTAIGSSCVTPWELTNAYTTFARGGLRPEPVFLKRIVDRDGVVLEEHSSPNDPWQTHEQRLDSLYRLLEQPPTVVMDAPDAYVINYMLTQVARHGTAAKASKLGRPVAGKTGTTNDSFDTWFVGYTPSLVASVWVGYDTYDSPLSNYEQGGRTSLPIWMEFMGKSLEGKHEDPWPEPPGICYARVDPRNGNRTFEAVPGSYVAPFRCGNEPKAAPVAGIQFEDAVKRGGI
jgi:penicillin-binding protein 1A